MGDKLLEKMFESDRWDDMIVKMNDVKELDKTLLRQLCKPEVRVRLYKAIKNGTYKIMNTHAALIPKDTPNEFRRVHICEDIDRCVLSLANDSFFELFPEMIDNHVWSYRKGKGSQEAVNMIVNQIDKMSYGDVNKHVYIGMKIDFHHFFDDVNIQSIDEVFNVCESKLGFEKGTEPMINVLRNFYHDDLIFDENGDLIHEYTGLRQGAAISSFLADVILNDIDKEMAKRCLYIRYSDDCLLLGENANEAYKVMLKMLEKYSVTINPKKVERLYSDTWFTFLGFKICGNKITLSHNRVKKFQKEIVSRSIGKRTTFKQAKSNIINYLYKGKYCWSTSCLGLVNVKADLDELNLFIMDCLRACKVRDTKRREGKRVDKKISISKIGGLGSVNDLPDKTIIRGKGRNVTRNRNQTDKTIEDYLSMGCLSNNMKLGRVIYDACVRAL